MNNTEAIELIRKIDEQLNKRLGFVNHNTREMPAVFRRMAYYELLYGLLDLKSSQNIGRVVGLALCRGKIFDHATVIHARQKSAVFTEVNDKYYLSVLSAVYAAYNDLNSNYTEEIERSFIDGIFA